MSVREFSALMMVCLIWGLHFVVMKLTVENTAPPLFYAAVRMTIVAILLAPFLRVHKGQMKYVLGAGLGYGALNYAFMFPALGMTTAAAAAVTIELFVPFSIILSMIVFKDKIGRWQFLGIVLAFCGSAFIAGAGPSETAGPLYLLGIFLMMGAAMSEAVGAVLVKLVDNIKPLELLAWFAVVGTCVLWPLTFMLEDHQEKAFAPENRHAFLAALAYSALLVSILAHGTYYWLLQRLEIYKVATTGLMTTVIGVMGGAFLLGETISPIFILGGLLTLAGVAIVLFRKKHKNPIKRG